MTRQQWQDLYIILDSISSRFSASYREYEHGKNKKIKQQASREVDSAIQLADLHIMKSWAAYELLTGGPNMHVQTRANFYDEFKMPKYFDHEMRTFLAKIRETIQNFDTKNEQQG